MCVMAHVKMITYETCLLTHLCSVTGGYIKLNNIWYVKNDLKPLGSGFIKSTTMSPLEASYKSCVFRGRVLWDHPSSIPLTWHPGSHPWNHKVWIPKSLPLVPVMVVLMRKFLGHRGFNLSKNRSASVRLFLAQQIGYLSDFGFCHVII